MWPEKCTSVVFVVTRTPAMDGVNSVVGLLAQELQQRSVSVSFMSLNPGRGQPLGQTMTIQEQEELHLGPVFRSAVGFRARARGLFLVAFKRADRWRANRRYRRSVESMGDETLVVFTHVWPKARLDETGYRRGPHGPLFVGQHHSSHRSVADFTPMADEHRIHFADLDAFLALTEEDARGFATLMPNVPCFAMPNPAPPSSRAPAPEPSRHPEAVFVGRYWPEKRLDFMIRAFVEATRERDLQHWHLRLYGSGDAEALDRTIAELGVSGRVHVMGQTDDVAGAFSHASVNLLASVFEGWPMTVVEAAQAGVPTVSFDSSPGTRALITPGTGWLVPYDDDTTYVSALREALAHPEELKRRGEAARQHVSQFDVSTVVDRWGEMVEACYSRRDDYPTLHPCAR